MLVRATSWASCGAVPSSPTSLPALMPSYCHMCVRAPWCSRRPTQLVFERLRDRLRDLRWRLARADPIRRAQVAAQVRCMRREGAGNCVRPGAPHRQHRRRVRRGRRLVLLLSMARSWLGGRVRLLWHGRRHAAQRPRCARRLWRALRGDLAREARRSRLQDSPQGPRVRGVEGGRRRRGRMECPRQPWRRVRSYRLDPSWLLPCVGSVDLPERSSSAPCHCLLRAATNPPHTAHDRAPTLQVSVPVRVLCERGL